VQKIEPLVTVMQMDASCFTR